MKRVILGAMKRGSKIVAKRVVGGFGVEGVVKRVAKRLARKMVIHEGSVVSKVLDLLHSGSKSGLRCWCCQK